jgi:solute carrier family 35 protein E3
MALAVLLFGVGVATVTDLQLNRLGSLLSLFAVLTTCISQIVSSKQSIHSILFSLH